MVCAPTDLGWVRFPVSSLVAEQRTHGVVHQRGVVPRRGLTVNEEAYLNVAVVQSLDDNLDHVDPLVELISRNLAVRLDEAIHLLGG